jgi:hypothetical protein
MNNNGRDKKVFGVFKPKKLRSFGKGVNKVGKSISDSSHYIDLGGDLLMASGDPRAVAVGEGLKGAAVGAQVVGSGLQTGGRVLKSAKKSKKK